MSKIALLTGVTGFIGGHLAKKLLEEGWQVHCLVRKQSSWEKIQKRLDYRLKVHVLEYDNSNLSEIIANIRPNIVFHLASLFLAKHKSEDIATLIASNITFGTQLVEAMVKNKVYYLINTGTSWQHYQSDDYNPVCLYAATKQAFADILKFYQEAMNLKVITLNLFDTYGINDERPKLFALLKRLYESGEEMAMSAGEQYIDIVHIDDVVEAYLLAAKYLLSNKQEYLGEYAISSGERLILRKLVEIFEQAVDKKLNIIWGKRPYREREVMIPWENGRKLSGWKPKISLENGIKNYME